jgi:ERF superfamily
MNEALTTQPIRPPSTVTQSGTLIDLLRAAVDKGADVATLERLAKLYEAAELGQKKAEFNNALAAAKAELRPVIKDKQVGTLYKYETMAAIAAEIDPVLAKHGLFAIFPDAEHTEKREGNRIYVTCRLSHRNGYSIEKTLDGPPDTGQNRNAIQAMGSTMTYLQRYALRAILGLAVSNEKENKERFTGKPPIDGPAQEAIYKPDKPMEIPRGDEEWQHWTAELLRMINSAPSRDNGAVIEQWVEKNKNQLTLLLTEIPAHHAFVQREITKRLRKLRDTNEAQRGQGSTGAGKR